MDGTAVKSAFALLSAKVTKPMRRIRRRILPTREKGELLKRTISFMTGKGSVNHNSRKFHAKNTNPQRSHWNVEYCNQDIRVVYHELFDGALERYNAKQTRKDRKIEDYYEKIRSGKQENHSMRLSCRSGIRMIWEQKQPKGRSRQGYWMNI